MFSKRLGAAVHLPRESQWELACHAGTATGYWWGPEFEKEHCNADESCIGRTLGRRESAAKFRNPWGLYHTSGNVLEWFFDWYSSQGSFRVLRGGSFRSNTRFCRSSYRDNVGPHFLFYSIGFRLCLSSVFRSRSDP